MRYADPDFGRLSTRQRKAIAGALICGCGEHLSPLQDRLIRALSRALLGLDLDAHPPKPVAPEALAAALDGVDKHTRERVAQFFVMLELVLDPLPPEAVESAARYIRALGLDEGLLTVARDYAQGAYGLALKDLQRKGYFGDFSGHPEVERTMHVQQHLTRPFDSVEHDPALLAEWQALERCRPGTLGRAIWEFYVGRGFVLAGQPGSVSPTLAQHDWVHVLADYGTVIDSELEVFAFIAAAIPDPKGFSFLAAVIGLFETGRVRTAAGGVLQADPGHLDLPGMPERLADALRRGRICNRDLIYGVDYFDYVNTPIGAVRGQLDIVSKSAAAVAAGSVGVNDAGGITPWQRAHGDARFQPPEA